MGNTAEWCTEILSEQAVHSIGCTKTDSLPCECWGVFTERRIHTSNSWTRLCSQAVIYVVDSTDTERISTSREEFHAILEEEELKESLILVYANKQVSPTAEGKFTRFKCPAAGDVCKSEDVAFGI